MSCLLFQVSLGAYFLATAAYLVFFITQKSQMRRVARMIFFTAAILHSANIIARYLEAGHTPITSIHETISFFAWSINALL